MTGTGGRRRGSGLGRVAILGSGQVGTMLGLALRRHGGTGGVAEISIFDVDKSVARASLRRGAADRLLAGPEDALGADTLILAVPVPAILRLIETLGPRLRAGSFLVDTGSAKAVVVDTMRRFVPHSAHALGAHPMAGTEIRGPAGARPELLRGAPFALVTVRDDPQALARGRHLVRAVGARPVVLDAEAHDRVVARTSHLPHLVAAALAEVASSAAKGPAERLVSTGLTGTTRLAASDPDMVAGFLWANGGQVRRAVAELLERLSLATAALDGAPGQSRALAAMLAEAGRAAERLGVTSP